MEMTDPGKGCGRRMSFIRVFTGAGYGLSSREEEVVKPLFPPVDSLVLIGRNKLLECQRAHTKEPIHFHYFEMPLF